MSVPYDEPASCDLRYGELGVLKVSAVVWGVGENVAEGEAGRSSKLAEGVGADPVSPNVHGPGGEMGARGALEECEPVRGDEAC